MLTDRMKYVRKCSYSVAVKSSTHADAKTNFVKFFLNFNENDQAVAAQTITHYNINISFVILVSLVVPFLEF